MNNDTRIRELAVRRTNGTAVALLWRKSDNQVRVAVRDLDTREAFELVVAPEHALDAFNHPYAYAAMNGLQFRTDAFAAAA
jgi:hypothetical protein